MGYEFTGVSNAISFACEHDPDELYRRVSDHMNIYICYKLFQQC